MYANHSPTLSMSFAAFCNGSADGNKTFAGTTISQGIQGYGFHAGSFGDDNVGAGSEPLADENLDMRHFKRG